MQTPHQVLGPFFPLGLKPAIQGDLTTVEEGGGQAQGEIIEVKGRILDLQGEPVAGARLTIWQANTFGRYVHPNDLNPAPLDPNFVGFGTIQSGNVVITYVNSDGQLNVTISSPTGSTMLSIPVGGS